jgi:superfamily II DNA or RNA helicase
MVVETGGQSRRYKLSETLLRRWLLPARTPVAIAPMDSQDELRAGIVIGVYGEPDPKAIWTYVVHTETGTEQIPEQRLRVLKIHAHLDDPVERLELNGWRGPRRFFARLCLLERTTIWKQDSEGIPAFLGARIEPLFHQFYAARRCLLDRETRFLLADEVGLGKTIEAGLVIQSLLAAKPSLRVIVVSPGTTSRQWLSELYCRFGGRVFTHVDSTRYDRRAQRKMDALLKNDRLIVTTSMLRTHPKALTIVAGQKWDLLVVDEGHHLVNWPELTSVLLRISEAASGCLVLTATPGRGDDKGLLEMLRLVAPGTYGSVTLSEFAGRLEPQRIITEKLLYSEELVAALLARGEIGEDDARELAEQWMGLFPNDPIVNESLARMEQGDGEAVEELVAHIQEHYRVDRRIIRTRRRTLGEYGNHYASRSLEIIEYDPCPSEVAVTEQVEELIRRTDVHSTWKAFWARYVCTTPSILQYLLRTRLDAVSGVGPENQVGDPLAVDLGPAEEEAALQDHLSSGPTFLGEELWIGQTLAQVERWNQTEEFYPKRFLALSTWLDRRIRIDHKKTLVFSQSRAVVEELACYLRKEFGEDVVAVMTHNLPDDEISEVSYRFERRPSCLLLLSDEVGAEGRNFQFADAVVHLDQPSVVARIEQRIGRLDRIGRPIDQAVLSAAVTGPFEIERAFLELHRDVFRVYERSIGGLEYLLPHFQQLIFSAATDGAQALRALSQNLLPKLNAEEQRVDEAFSFFLDATRPELERAKQLSELVADRSGDEDGSFVRDWCKELRINLITQELNCVKVEARLERLDEPLPILESKDWVKTGTFLRSVAIDMPGVQYFAPGHLFIDALLQSARETQDARATAFFRDLGAHSCGHVFCVVVGRLGPDESAFSNSLPPGLLRRAEHYLPVEWVRSAFEILQDGEITSVPPGTLSNQLLKDYQVSDQKCHPDHISQIIERFPGLWVGLRVAVDAAKQTILDQKSDEIEAAAAEFYDALRPELAYLRAQASSSTDSDIIQSFRDREALLESVRYPSVVTDAVAIVVGSRGR